MLSFLEVSLLAGVESHGHSTIFTQSYCLILWKNTAFCQDDLIPNSMLYLHEVFLSVPIEHLECEICTQQHTWSCN